MENIEILERYYKTFIDNENPRDFFIGMTDYFEFTEKVPEFEAVCLKLIQDGHKKSSELESLAKSLIVACDKIKEKIEEYIKTNQIKELAVTNSLQEYNDWKDGKIAGSLGVPLSLHDCLFDTLEAINRDPKHLTFVSEFAKVIQVNEKPFLSKFTFKEYEDYRELNDEIDRDLKLTLWGQLGFLLELYNVIKKGRKEYKDLVTEHKETRSIQTSWKIMNYSIIVGEWKAVEENNERHNYFFKISVARPWLIRLHNHIISTAYLKKPEEISQKNDTAEDAVVKTTDFIYDINTGDGKFKDKEFRLKEETPYRKIFDACYLIKGEKLEKQQVVKILGSNDKKDEDLGKILSALGDDVARKKSVSDVKITADINKAVITIRNKTGLNTKQLVNNGGNIILNV